MSILPVLKHPDKRLREVAKNITLEKLRSKEVQALIEDLTDTMIADDGIGIAATQVGTPHQVFVLGGKTRHDAQVFVNPKIVSFSQRETYMEEGCLSVPGVYGLVKRPVKVRLKALDRHGKPVDVKATGLTAKVFQHEVDHLNGILFIDKAERIVSGGLKDGAAGGAGGDPSRTRI
ncbi:MAG: peptide deformylase [Candidatus Kerfeldbacteria bacterium RIFCSPHIGHO2_12_FULL_48_17]|uniref:Peptide deformylase n=1 Tax=Candidatus Kerfeldbacteria bacterium RIFCSPHIGHO2_12_FULL_48_17 TaxID=1798542 RepID=A0A1G2AYZ2_9BACT|nr:MAG: peptide deformylase [Candidatus Kerfeldbacteria bacterium RIFCSPHIGHO2_12_FULL_48_17]